MLSKTVFIIIFLGVTATGFCQSKDTSYYQRPLAIVSYLKPIEISNGRYYYGSQRLNSPYSFEIPFYELNDQYVNLQFRRYKNIRTVASLIGIIPSLYFIYTISYRQYNNNTYWIVFGTSIAGSLTCSALGNSYIKKAIEGYNVRIMNNKIGFSVQPLPNQTMAYGMGYTWEF